MKQVSESASFSNEHIFQQANYKQAQLQNRLNSYFQNRRSSKQPNNSNNSNNTTSNRALSTNTMDFRILFTKPQPNNDFQHSFSNDNENTDELNNRQQIPYKKQTHTNQSRKKVHSEYTLSKKQTKQSLSKKKMNLMEFKLKQLEQEVELELQKKIDIYKQNEQIEKEIKKIEEKMKQAKTGTKIEEDDFDLEVLELEANLRKQKQRNRTLKKQIEMLKQKKTLPQQQIRTQYSSNKTRELESSKNTLQIEHLRAELQEQRNNYKKLKQKFQKNEELAVLSLQLKRLRKMVQKQASRKYR